MLYPPPCFVIMSFRCNARNFFLTWSQSSGLSKESILDFLKDDQQYSRFLSWAVVCQESHQEGGIHFHAVVGYSKKYDCRNARAFDISGFHPKLEAAKDVVASVSYVKKDGDFILFGDVPTAKRRWSELENASSAEEAFDIIKSVSFRDFVLNHEKIEYFVSKKFRREVPRYSREFGEFVIANAMQQWVDQRMVRDRPKSIILWGPSRTGKTAWARSLGSHMYFNGMFDLSMWDDAAEYAVFDDFPEWEKWRYYKQFLGGQYEFVVTDKYCKKRTVRWSKPCILISNVMPNFPDMEWIRANCFIVNIQASLF